MQFTVIVKDEAAKAFSQEIEKLSDDCCGAEDVVYDQFNKWFGISNWSITYPPKVDTRFPIIKKRVNLYTMICSIRQMIEVDIKDYIKKIKEMIDDDAKLANESSYKMSFKKDILMTVEIVNTITEEIERG